MAQFEKKLAHVFQTGCTFGRLAPVSPSPRPSPTRGEGETPIRESRPSPTRGERVPSPLRGGGLGGGGSVGVRRKMDAGGGAIHKHPLSDVTRLPSDRAGGNPWAPRSCRGRVHRPQTSHKHRPPESGHSGARTSPPDPVSSAGQAMRRNDDSRIGRSLFTGMAAGISDELFHRKVTTERHKAA